MSANINNTVETFGNDLSLTNPVTREERMAEIAWEMNRQARRAAWETKNDKRERPDDYRKTDGVACALPRKPAKKSKNA